MINHLKYLSEFIYQLLTNTSFEQEMINKGQGAAQKNIKNSDIENFCCFIPNSENNILMLSKIFRNIDKHYNSEVSLLNNLEIVKRGFLQQMFI